MPRRRIRAFPAIERTMIVKWAIAASFFLIDLTGCVPLASPVLEGAESYHDVLATNSNVTLVDNILRARDFAPLNISDLSTITGALSFTGSLTGNVPFGPLNGSNTPRTLSSMLTGSSTPTFTMAPLNTEGFTVNLIQPISPQYVVHRWHSGADHQFLLRMFIKWIRYYGGRECLNTPGENCFLELGPEVDVKSVTILDPIGPEYGISSSQTMVQSLQFLTGLGDAQYHVGNTATGNLQLYRIYPGQVIICVPAVTGAAPRSRTQNLRALKQTLKPTPSAAPPAPTGTGASSARPSPTPSPGGGTAQVTATAALQVHRISAILDNSEEACNADQVVLPRSTEEDIERASKTFAHVEWRSTSELFQYLGAIVHEGSLSRNIGDHNTLRNTFDLVKNQPGGGFITVAYRGDTYTVVGDNSFLALQMLSELVNLSKISSDIPVSSPTLFLPIP
jgi:hypothetical protein